MKNLCKYSLFFEKNERKIVFSMLKIFNGYN